jgi:hypothetical protein
MDQLMARAYRAYFLMDGDAPINHARSFPDRKNVTTKAMSFYATASASSRSIASVMATSSSGCVGGRQCSTGIARARRRCDMKYLLADPTKPYRRDGVGNLKGLFSENHLCVDCGVNTAPGLLPRIEVEIAFLTPDTEITYTIDEDSEVYIVNDKIWARAGMEGYGGCLCIGCLEKRIGRRLKRRDFVLDHPFNSMPGTPRLLDRRGGKCGHMCR